MTSRLSEHKAMRGSISKERNFGFLESIKNLLKLEQSFKQIYTGPELDKVTTKLYETLNDLIQEYQPLNWDLIQDIQFPKQCKVERIYSDKGIDISELYGLHHLVDAGYTNVYMSNVSHVKEQNPIFRRHQRKTLLKEAKILLKCKRGHFVFPSTELMIAYLKWWLLYLPRSRVTIEKYDWVLMSQDNVLHIRDNCFWLLNSSAMPYDIIKELQWRYHQIYTGSHTEIVKLDDSAVDFLNDVCGHESLKLKSLTYKVMDRRLFETFISEHKRIHSSDSPSMMRWASNYNLHYNRLANPSLTLSYVSTKSPELAWYSPIYEHDLKNEQKCLISILQSHEYSQSYH